MSAVHWAAYLDELAASLTRQRECLQADEPDIELDATPFDPPQHLGALPLSQVERARGLVRELDQVQALLVDRRDRTARRLQVQRRLRRSTAPPPASAYVDRRD